MDDRHVVWSNENLDLEDWRADLEEEYPGYSDDELYEIMCDTNSSYLSDERVNLNIQLSQPILVVADLGLWNGRRMGYKEIESGNIRDCLYSNYNYTTWYVDKNGDFRCDDSHHDGTNHLSDAAVCRIVQRFTNDGVSSCRQLSPEQSDKTRAERRYAKPAYLEKQSDYDLPEHSRRTRESEVKRDESKRHDRKVRGRYRSRAPDVVHLCASGQRYRSGRALYV